MYEDQLKEENSESTIIHEPEESQSVLKIVEKTFEAYTNKGPRSNQKTLVLH